MGTPLVQIILTAVITVTSLQVTLRR